MSGETFELEKHAAIAVLRLIGHTGFLPRIVGISTAFEWSRAGER